MTPNDVGMAMSVGSVIGLVVVCLLGLLFVVSCLASVVKAFRDRREIKARIAAKRVGSLGSEGNRSNRGRPNILIIHDGEREQRVKKFSSHASPGVGSPAEQTSHHTESTTVVDVSPQVLASPDISPSEETLHDTASSTMAEMSSNALTSLGVGYHSDVSLPDSGSSTLAQMSSQALALPVSSPSEETLHDTACTTIAEMSSYALTSLGVGCHSEETLQYTDSSTVTYSSLGFQARSQNDSSGSMDRLQASMAAVKNHSGNCSLPGPIRHVYKEEIGVDISGDVIRYSGSPLLPCSGHPRGIVQTFPGGPGDDGGSGKRAGGDRVPDGARGKTHGHQNCSGSSLKHVAEGGDGRRGGRGSTEEARGVKDTPSPTVHGFAKKKKVSPRHHVVPGTVEHNVYAVSYNPRRSSYAAAISSDPDWMDRATVRRHSDEARAPVASATRPRSRDNARMRSQCRNGADNPAYNAADDRIDM